MVAWGPIIGAGISALGSLFGDDDEQVTRTEVDYVAMARNAEKAGFNPLTAIRNGGSAGFVNTFHPGLSMETRLGSAFQTMGNAIMAWDPRADERAALEQRIQEATLQRLNLTNEAASHSFAADPPIATASTRVGPGNRALGTEGNPYPLTVKAVDPRTGRIYDIPNPEIGGGPEDVLFPGAVRSLNDVEGTTVYPPGVPRNPAQVYDLPAELRRLTQPGVTGAPVGPWGIPLGPTPNPKPQGNGPDADWVYEPPLGF